MAKSPVFDQTYQKYLDQIAALDLHAMQDKLGLVRDGDDTIVRVINNDYRINLNAITDRRGKVPELGISVIIAKYILRCPETAPDDKTICAYRDFKDAGPLIHYFTNNAELFLAERFSNRAEQLAERCRQIGGKSYPSDLGYDVKYSFEGLPKIPILLLFNDADEFFPAECKLLFHRCAEIYLDMESLAILGVMLAQELSAGNIGTAPQFEFS